MIRLFTILVTLVLTNSVFALSVTTHLEDLNYSHPMELTKRSKRSKLQFKETFKVAVMEKGSMDVTSDKFNEECRIKTDLSSDFDLNTLFSAKKYTYIKPSQTYKLGFISYNEYLNEIRIRAYKAGSIPLESIALWCVGISPKSTIQDLMTAYGDTFKISL